MNKIIKIDGSEFFWGALFLIFLTLKLTHHIDWSWWWIFLPIWLPALIAISIITLPYLFMLIGALLLVAVAFVWEGIKKILKVLK